MGTIREEMTLSMEDRRNGGIASGIAKRRAALRRSEHLAFLDGVLEGLDREDVPVMAFGMFVKAARSVAESEIDPPETAGDLLKTVEAAALAQKIMRLELGESTANTISANVDMDKLAERIAALRADDAPASSASDSASTP